MEAVAAHILVVDDSRENLHILRIRLEAQGYQVGTAPDGEEALTYAAATPPDLILLDVMMPRLSGLDVLRLLKADEALRYIPVVLLTARAETRDLVEGLDAGADEYLTKPYEHAALMARVRSMLRLKALTDRVRAQSHELAEQRAALAEANRDLESQVAVKAAELERIGRLRRFLSPQIADLVATERDGHALLEAHRREITVVFCDLRGFTAFTDSAAPEEVVAVLREYHKTVGQTVFHYEGTLEHFAGDGIMVFFNDPRPCPDHSARAVRMAFALRERVGRLARQWEARGHTIGFGLGLARGYATLGQFGFEGRFEYGAVGSVTNLASRLCDKAQSGQIVISRPVLSAVEGIASSRSLGNLTLKGFLREVPAFELVTLLADQPVT
ncbi:Adenylate and Guanylate cyclase catalytic domain-containing protein [Methylobacterium pseudosasicola]|uniref:Adenylate and Guanylate cyclase catalytic domain-containing protein n=1 Tax=Methylobacterium pseudosasicola TaxID=582667 RepID=A0A1I4RBR9_9HYPH|nr:Adenylate and Guanylate cyclase catalytic domain-containing protein [Methylobacterium pseudosasicola]